MPIYSFKHPSTGEQLSYDSPAELNPEQQAAVMLQLIGQPAQQSSNPLARLRDALTGSVAGQLEQYKQLTSSVQFGQTTGGFGQTPQQSPAGIHQEALSQARGQIPQNPTELLLGLALLSHGALRAPAATFGQAALQALERTGIAGTAGLAGGTLEGKGPVEAALSTGGPTAALELGMLGIPATQAAARHIFGYRATSAVDLKDMIGSIQKSMPGLPATPGLPTKFLGAPEGSIAKNLQTADDLYKFVQVGAKEQAGKTLDVAETLIQSVMRKEGLQRSRQAIEGRIARGLPKPDWLEAQAITPNVHIPALNEFAGIGPEVMMPVGEAFALKKQLRNAAYGNTPLSKRLSDTGYDARREYARVLDQIETAIEQVTKRPEMVQLYKLANQQEAQAFMLHELFTGGPEGLKAGELRKVFPKEGKFNVSALQGPRFDALYAYFDKRGLKPVADTITRGAGPTYIDQLRQTMPFRFLFPSSGAATQLPPIGVTTYGGRSPVPTGALTSPQGQSIADYLTFLATQQSGK